MKLPLLLGIFVVLPIFKAEEGCDLLTKHLKNVDNPKMSLFQDVKSRMSNVGNGALIVQKNVN